MHKFSFAATRALHVEVGAANHLAQIAADRGLGAGHVFFVTDPGIMQLGLAAGAIESFERVGARVTVFDAVEADPPADVVLRAVEDARIAGASLVVGFGGGSAMDVAKLVAYLVGSGDTLDAIFGVGLARGRRLPLILVPTTAGTGSEATMVSVVTVGTSEKKGVVSASLLPDLGVLDAELTLGLPPHITAATGIDAMVHAIEAYTSRSLNNNPLSRMIAREALSLLGSNIEQAVFNGRDRAARANMLLGAAMAGMAFCNAPVAAVHALAYPVGTLFHVPHGLSNALVLPHVMRFNASMCGAEYAELAALVFPDLAGVSDGAERCEAFVLRLAALSARLGLQQRLRDVGIGSGDLDRLAADAMNQTRLLVNNPRRVGLADAREIYQRAF
ncbi:iron-containing alcohol dehydrogenase [Inquilinus sp. OTU3971]|uniref:iron-containing alcohol dehydrogenase n=1 Tax=Inquilinus sp. OTU3971 TaxID=3043855 RepID=UPI00313C81CD